MPRADKRLNKAQELVWPTEPNQFGQVALIKSDFNPALVRELAPYDTIGDQRFYWRTVLDGSSFTQVALTDAQLAFAFALNQCYGYADLTATFDQYRLKAVSVAFMPNVASLGAGNTTPRLWTCIDYDDNNNVARAAIEQYDTCICAPPGTGVVRTLKPRMAVAAYSGAFTSFANMQDQWIDAASPSVQHFGVKAVMEGGASGQTALQTYTTSLTLFWEFRATR
jgi:hypothetical protein